MWSAIRGLLGRAESAEADEPDPPSLASDETDAVHSDGPMTREDWEWIQEDPDDRMLGYEATNLEIATQEVGGRRREIWLPDDPAMIEEDAFVIVPREDVVEPERRV